MNQFLVIVGILSGSFAVASDDPSPGAYTTNQVRQYFEQKSPLKLSFGENSKPWREDTFYQLYEENQPEYRLTERSKTKNEKGEVDPLQLVDEKNLELLVWDTDDFLSKMVAPDLATARMKYFSKLKWNDETLDYDRPYAYLEGWAPLFHPPIMTLDHPLAHYNVRFDEAGRGNLNQAFFDVGFQKELDAASDTELTQGNVLKYLPNTNAYAEKLRLVNDAKKFLFIAIMGFTCDESSHALLDAIIARKRAGVEVRIITEALYRSNLNKYCVDKMVRAGVEAITSKDSVHFSTLTSMMHQKLWIRDGEEAILGGQNILDYENKATGFNGYNRDSDVLIVGPTATDVFAQYLSFWKEYDDELEERPITKYEQFVENRKNEERTRGVRGVTEYSRWLSDPSLRMKGICRVALQGVSAKKHPIGSLLTKYVEESRAHIFITSPMFTVGIEDLAQDALEESAKETWLGRFTKAVMEKIRGRSVHVDVLANGIGGGIGESNIWLKRHSRDTKRKNLYFLSMIYELLFGYSGFKETRDQQELFRYMSREGDFMGWSYFNYYHGKQFLFDRTASGIGSWNIDSNSADMNHETMLICLDEGLRDALEAQFTLDTTNSIPVLPTN